MDGRVEEWEGLGGDGSEQEGRRGKEKGKRDGRRWERKEFSNV